MGFHIVIRHMHATVVLADISNAMAIQVAHVETPPVRVAMDHAIITSLVMAVAHVEAVPRAMVRGLELPVKIHVVEVVIL